jgi:hypothetical protein
VHDKTKVAVCLKFLRGACDNADCPLSHTADQAKMPMCMYFVRGRCDKGAECVFAHVQVAPDAPVCQDFVKGVASVLFVWRNAILVSASSLSLMGLLGAICVRFKAAVLAVTRRHAEQTRRVCAADDRCANMNISSNVRHAGYCPRGFSCTDKHTWECPSFAESGACPAVCPSPPMN